MYAEMDSSVSGMMSFVFEDHYPKSTFQRVSSLPGAEALAIVSFEINFSYSLMTHSVDGKRKLRPLSKYFLSRISITLTENKNPESFLQ